MYRLLFTLACISIVSAAPQDSKITYVKRHIDSDNVNNRKHEPRDNSREEKVEIVPLTISVSSEDLTETIDLEKPKGNIKEKQTNNNPDYNYSDRIYSIKTKPKKNIQTTTTDNSIPPVIEATSIKIPESIPAESKQTDTVIKTDETTQNNYINASTEIEQVSTESADITTKYEEEATTGIDEETTKLPTTTKATTTSVVPKLSYINKSYPGSFSRNLIGNSGKRKFRSRCRCEKIWNCAKLQISVARCPDEYFLCCA